MFVAFEASGADFLAGAVFKMRPLEIGITAGFSRRVELFGANAVGISSSHHRSLIAYRTLFCHGNLLYLRGVVGTVPFARRFPPWYHKEKIMQIEFLFVLAIVVMSIIIHEISHGYMAHALGDKTAEYAGRLTLNPVSHIDILGSIIVPLLAYMSAGFVFGWAKPVPYNPFNLRNRKWGTVLVAGAGALSNFAIALVFALLIRSGFAESVSTAFVEISAFIVLANIGLAVFNLLPFPPLDGSKILFALLPFRLRHVQDFLDQYWFIVIVLVILFGGEFIFPAVSGLFTLMTGLPLAFLF